MNLETILGLGGFFGVVLFLVLLVLTILMPIFVMFISHRTQRMAETLAKMEDMMRNGK